VKLVFYTENYVVGGCDRFLADLIENLDHDLFDVQLAGNPNPSFDRWLADRLPSHLPRHEVVVATLPNSRLVRRTRPALLGTDGPSAGRRGIAAVGSAGLRYAQVALNYRRLRRLFRELRPDVLHINNGGYPGAETCRLAALAARAEGVPGIVHFVHSTATPPVFPSAVERAFDRRIDAATDVWVTAADRAASALHEHRAIPRDRIRTVHYGIAATRDAGRARPAARDGRPPTAVVVASFDPGKGHAVLIDALAALERDGFALRTLLVGTGPERDAVERRAVRAGVDGDVRFLGWRDDVPRILDESDLLVLPSIAFECLPYSILEAMLHGLPVVASDLAGIPEEVIDGETGRVVPPGDAPALARAIRDVLGDPARARAMGEKGRERVESTFGLDRMVAQMREIYLSLGTGRAA
jgi:glycosyltransferase involved in cell wall biosynthesis